MLGDVHRGFLTLDADGSGELDFDECVSAFSDTYKSSAEARNHVSELFRSVGRRLDENIVLSDFVRLHAANYAAAAPTVHVEHGAFRAAAGGLLSALSSPLSSSPPS